MIDEKTFDTIFERAKKYKYSSMNYIDFGDCKDAIILYDNDDMILLHDKSKTPTMLYFATNDFEELVKVITALPGKLRLHFVPREFAPQLVKAGFTEWAEFIDFWNIDLAKTKKLLNNKNEPEYLAEDECEKIVALMEKCALQSRGFESVSLEYALEWLADGKVIICRKDSEIVGFCSVSIYNEGTTLWVRVIAVDPAYQGHGIAKVLMAQAVKYGIQNGAVKGFLAADLLNSNAIGLFNKFDFSAKDPDGELQMIRE